jgi:hypothetical protein
MSHFAKIDKDGVVTDIVSSEQDYINKGHLGDSFLWVQTSYNDNFRKRFAQIGGTYDKVNDVFLDPKPHASFTLNTETFEWEAPKAHPITGEKTVGPKTGVTDANWKTKREEDIYAWDEDKGDWVEQVYDPDLDPADWDTTKQAGTPQDTSDLPDWLEDLDSPKIVVPF